jgi:hypothetical protein
MPRSPEAKPEKRPATGAARQAKYAAAGRQIACVIRDPAALAALDRLAQKHGGVTAAVTAALVSSSKSSSRKAV